jgi:hypothetical protein
MDDIVKEVAQKTGLSEDMARTAVQTVVQVLKDKLPAPLAGQIDGLLGNPDTAKTVGDLASGLGGLLGGNK